MAAGDLAGAVPRGDGDMNLMRLMRHLSSGRAAVRRAFPPHTLNLIERAIRETEAMHTGQIRFAVEPALDMKLLLAGHKDVVLTPEEIERLVTWMDTNALFYGTFNPADQARQQRGERIAGPEIQ